MKEATIRDNYPLYPPAGLCSTTADPPVLSGSSGEVTPSKLHLYRKSHIMSVGARMLRRTEYHPDPNQVYGVPTVPGDGIKSCLSPAPPNLPRALLEAKENIYASNRLEPLGRGLVRGHVFPAHVLQPDFMFGNRTAPTNTTTKDTIQNGRFIAESEKAHELYKASHRDVYPGEQKTRKYDWPFDPAKHVFAKPNAGDNESVDMCLKMNTPDHMTKHSSSVISKCQSDFNALTKEGLGQSLTNRQSEHCEQTLRTKAASRPLDVASTLAPGPLQDDGRDGTWVARPSSASATCLAAATRDALSDYRRLS